MFLTKSTKTPNYAESTCKEWAYSRHTGEVNIYTGKPQGGTLEIGIFQEPEDKTIKSRDSIILFRWIKDFLDRRKSYPLMWGKELPYS